MVALIACSLCVYSHVFITSGFETNEVKANERPQVSCVTLEKWLGFVKVFILVDSFLTIIVPSVVIASINLLIIIKVFI